MLVYLKKTNRLRAEIFCNKRKGKNWQVAPDKDGAKPFPTQLKDGPIDKNPL